MILSKDGEPMLCSYESVLVVVLGAPGLFAVWDVRPDTANNISLLYDCVAVPAGLFVEGKYCLNRDLSEIK